jgi:hypothetical protein
MNSNKLASTLSEEFLDMTKNPSAAREMDKTMTNPLFRTMSSRVKKTPKKTV